MILVIGATGTVGSEVVRQLREGDAPVRALVRSRERGAPLEDAGAQLALGDATNLDAALEGVDRVFLVLPAGPNQVPEETDAIDAVVRAGSPPLVKLSVIRADPRSPVRFLADHGRIEDLLGESGVPHTVLRANDFMQNALRWAPAFAQGTIHLPIPEARIASVDIRDIAAAAVATLTQDGHEGRVYELSGPDALSRREQVATLAAAAGRDVEIVPVATEQALGAMVEMGMPRWNAEGLAELWTFYEQGHAATPATGVRDATGREPRSFADFARDHAELFAH